VIALSAEAEYQLDDLLAHYEWLDRIEAAQKLMLVLEQASIRILGSPHSGALAPGPYPVLAKYGLRWIKVGPYWIAYEVATRATIIGVFYETADIPNRLSMRR
jgi:plasmid stabilization system protein ParE